MWIPKFSSNPPTEPKGMSHCCRNLWLHIIPTWLALNAAIKCETCCHSPKFHVSKLMNYMSCSGTSQQVSDWLNSFGSFISWDVHVTLGLLTVIQAKKTIAFQITSCRALPHVPLTPVIFPHSVVTTAMPVFELSKYSGWPSSMAVTVNCSIRCLAWFYVSVHRMKWYNSVTCA